MLMAVAGKAITQTSDDALIQFARWKISQLQEVGRASPKDCYAVLSGESDIGLAARIMAYASEKTKQESQRVTAFVIQQANKSRQFDTDKVRFGRLIARIEARLKASGLSINFLTPDTRGLTARERCNAGIQFYTEALNLQEPDRSFMLRNLLTDQGPQPR
jgi:hypothetical protein